MKRRNFFALALVAMVLVLGVGYATVSQVILTISGDAAVKDTDLKVVFNGNTTTDLSGKSSDDAAVEASSVDGGLTANIKVTGLTKVGETVSATYEIENRETDLNASVIEKTITNDKSEFFEVTTDMTTAKPIAAEGKTTVTVTVKLIKLPIISDDSTANITVELTATPVALD